jgi:hypothetical protein
MRQGDLFDWVPRARPTDPATSHEAVADINITQQCYLILRAYACGLALTDHDAYRLAGFPPTLARQRCSDLRHAGFIERTGDRGATPSGKAAFLCRITQAGLDYLK